MKKKYIAPNLQKKVDDSLKYIIYRGSSMNPLLKDRDIVQVCPYNGKKVRRGDVIVFFSTEEAKKIIHRIISFNMKGIKTRGDNNRDVDPWILKHDDIVGQVIYVQKGNRERRVFGGPTGILSAHIGRAINMIYSGISFLLKPIYSWLSQTDTLRKLMPFLVKTKIVTFKRPSGTELQLLMGRYVIGKLPSGKDQWQIWRPFHLFVNETSLPKNPYKSKHFK